MTIEPLDDGTNVAARAVKCEDCECDQSCKTGMTTQNGEDQLPDHLGETTEPSLLDLDYMTVEDNIEARSVKCISPDYECNRSYQTDMPIIVRRINLSPNCPTSERITTAKGPEPHPTPHESTKPGPTGGSSKQATK